MVVSPAVRRHSIVARLRPVNPKRLARSMILGPLFRRSPHKDAAHALYVEAVRQARQPSFYASCGVPDTLDGRFDLIVLHVFLVMRALAQAGETGQKVGSAVLDVMFDDMDMNLREMGVGDLSVGKKVKAMARAYYGRAKAYGEALAPDAAPGLLAVEHQSDPGDGVEAAAAIFSDQFGKGLGHAIEPQRSQGIVGGVGQQGSSPSVQWKNWGPRMLAWVIGGASGELSGGRPSRRFRRIDFTEVMVRVLIASARSQAASTRSDP